MNGPEHDAAQAALREQDPVSSTETANAHDELLESLFFYYGENVGAAERSTREG